MYRLQEKQRYSQPDQCFTYHIHGYTTTVGPIKGLSNYPSKAKSHGLLLNDGNRPPFVTIINLVKDSVARLPNGQGTRPDIVELLKDSQYLNPYVDPSSLTSAVSGALDRLQNDSDPCVKFDGGKKIWVYLHHGRTESDFLRIQNEQLSMSSPPLPKSKAKRKKKEELLATTTTTKAKTAYQSILNQSSNNTSVASSNLITDIKVPTTPPQQQQQQQQQQTVQLMTPDGLKTYKLNIPQQPPPTPPSQTPSTLVVGSNKSESKSILAKKQSVLLNHHHQQSPQQHQQQQQHVTVSTGVSTTPSITTPNITTTQPQQQQQTPLQRVIVKNSEGKPVQLTAARLQKLFASGALKSGLQIALPGSSKSSTLSTTPIQPNPRPQQIITQQHQQIKPRNVCLYY